MPTGSIQIELSGFRNDKGLARIYLHNSPEGFPKKRENAIKAIAVPIKDGRASAAFDSVQYGIFAVSVHHDENNNEKVDTNFIKMPREGFGASNNPKSSFGPPKYKNASFELKTDTLRLEIKMKYLGGK
jgi:uncharacterized protein (DUF2141 family)